MIRKFNYTGRKKIKRSNVRIDLTRDDGGRRFFNIGLQFDDLELPPDAKVYVEAYHRFGYQRYDFGTVGQLVIPADRCLTGFSASASALRSSSSEARATVSGVSVRPITTPTSTS